jgi:hypothetical protein
MSFLALPPPLLNGEKHVTLSFTAQNWSAGIGILHHAVFVVDTATCKCCVHISDVVSYWCTVSVTFIAPLVPFNIDESCCVFRCNPPASLPQISRSFLSCPLEPDTTAGYNVIVNVTHDDIKEVIFALGFHGINLSGQTRSAFPLHSIPCLI